MNPLVWVLVGGLVVGVLFFVALGIGFLAVKSYRVLLRLILAVEESAKLQKSVSLLMLKIDKVSAQVGLVAQELAFMRAMTTQSVQAQGGTVPNQPAPSSVAPFPSVNWEMIRDAEVSDTNTNLLQQTDEDLTELDRLEQLRMSGVDVRPEEEQPAGTTVESE